MIKVKTSKEFLEVMKNKIKEHEIILFDKSDGNERYGMSACALQIARCIDRKQKHTREK